MEPEKHYDRGVEKNIKELLDRRHLLEEEAIKSETDEELIRQMEAEENCKDGSPHDWKTNNNDEWTDKGIENGKTIVLATYHAKTRKCAKCGAFEIISGNVVTRSGSEYMLNSDGTWGMGIS